MAISEWRAIRNRAALARLNKAIPDIFPGPVLTHALQRSFVPPMPRLAIDSYWRTHPVRADRLARALAARSGAPTGWTWRLGDEAGLAASFRAPPAPYREAAFARGGGTCCVCGQPVYRFGWHADLWGAGPNRNAGWHSACVTAWRLWNAPSDYARVLKRLQTHRCAASGGRLWKTAEVDHRVPLFRVWREHRDIAWPALLAFWGVPNLQVINRDVHAEKCAAEARTRSRADEIVAPGAFSGKVGTGFPPGNATKHKQPDRSPIQPIGKRSGALSGKAGPGFPRENATKHRQLDRSPIQPIGERSNAEKPAPVRRKPRQEKIPSIYSDAELFKSLR